MCFVLVSSSLEVTLYQFNDNLNCSLSRHNFLSELRSSGERLNIMQSEIANLCIRYSELKSSVDQRLKWAVGANPGLQEIVDGFSCEHQTQLDVIRQMSALLKSVVGVSQSALQFEALRYETIVSLTLNIWWKTKKRPYGPSMK